MFECGNLKIRGIEARRHDTPPLFSRCQNEILEIMAEGNTINEVKALMPKVKEIFQKYAIALKEQKVPIEELVFTKRLSKNPNEYQNRNTVENDALHLLENEGKYQKAGEISRYVISDYYSKKRNNNRAIPLELLDDNNNRYDVGRYMELLAETCNSVTEPFGHLFSAKDINYLL